jgi:DnaJ-class molecular chaperone
MKKTGFFKCPECLGTGYFHAVITIGNISNRLTITCKHCRGTGKSDWLNKILK